MQFDPDLVKTFVRGVLGCDCPNEVFYSIKFDHHYELEYQFYVDCALTIGNRLLVLVKTMAMEPTKKDKKDKKPKKSKKAKKDQKDQPEEVELDVKTTIEKLVAHGLRMRSDDELNRFRLVLVSKEPAKLEKELGDQFEKLIKGDDKAHLHVIDRRSMKGDYGFLIMD